MRKTLIVLAVVVLAAGLAVADDKTDVMAPVHQFVDSFNKGDAKGAAAVCDDQLVGMEDRAAIAGKERAERDLRNPHQQL